MTQDDIARMAREAWKHDCFSLWQKHMLKSLVHFANLVAAAEREECAKDCERLSKKRNRVARFIYDDAAEYIRARGQV